MTAPVTASERDLRTLAGIISEDRADLLAGGLSPDAAQGDAQVFLTRLTARACVYHFEVTRPSLQDIFVRIAKP